MTTFKPGDRVTMTGTVRYGLDRDDEVGVKVDGHSLTGCVYVNPDALTLITPAEPPVGSVVVVDGVAWTRCSEKKPGWYMPTLNEWGVWPALCHGDVAFTAGGDSA